MMKHLGIVGGWDQSHPYEKQMIVGLTFMSTASEMQESTLKHDEIQHKL